MLIVLLRVLVLLVEYFTHVAIWLVVVSTEFSITAFFSIIKLIVCYVVLVSVSLGVKVLAWLLLAQGFGSIDNVIIVILILIRSLIHLILAWFERLISMVLLAHSGWRLFSNLTAWHWVL